MPIEITNFLCNMCLKQYPDLNSAMQCESKNHGFITKTKPSYYAEEMYPHSIEVTFSTGMNYVFKREDLI